MPFTQSPFAREVRSLLPIALPLAASNLSLMAMALTNTIMVGRLGGHALSAAGLGGSLFFTLAIICQSVLTAVAPLAAGAIGGGDCGKAGNITAAGLLLAMAGAPLLIAVLSLIAPCLAAIGYEPSLAQAIGDYLAALRWGAPGMLAYGALRSLFAASHRARIVMAVLLCAIPANAALGWVLIFAHFGLPPLGIVGSGWGTAAIQWGMSLTLIAVLLAAPRGTRLRVDARRLARHVVEILRLGLPIGGMVALEVALFAVVGVLAGLLGADALAAHQLVLNFVSLTFMVPLGIGQAETVRIGHALGAGDPSTARRAVAVAVALAAGFTGTVAALIWLFPRALVGIYLNVGDPANSGAVAIALRLLAVAGIFQVFDTGQVIAAAGLRGYRDTTVPMALAALGYWLVGFCAAWLFAFPLGRGPVGLWWGLTLGLAAVAALLLTRLAHQTRTALRATASADFVLAGLGPAIHETQP